MAYDLNITPLGSSVVDGRRLLSWQIVQAEVDGEEWEIDVPMHFTITLFEQSITDSATVAPSLGLTSGWTTGTLDEIVVQSSAATLIRNQEAVRGVAPCKKLYGRANPSVSGKTVTTRITVLEGH